MKTVSYLLEEKRSVFNLVLYHKSYGWLASNAFCVTFAKCFVFL